MFVATMAKIRVVARAFPALDAFRRKEFLIPNLQGFHSDYRTVKTLIDSNVEVCRMSKNVSEYSLNIKNRYVTVLKIL